MQGFKLYLDTLLTFTVGLFNSNQKMIVWMQGLCSALENMPVPGHTVTAGGHDPGEGADFVLTEVTETLQKTRAHASLLKYLSALLSLRDSPYLSTTSPMSDALGDGSAWRLGFCIQQSGCMPFWMRTNLQWAL